MVDLLRRSRRHGFGGGGSTCGETLNPRHLIAELQCYSMRAFNWLLTLFFLVGCKESTQPQNTPQKPPETPVEPSIAHIEEERPVEYFVEILTPIIDPTKLMLTRIEVRLVNLHSLLKPL